MLKLGVTAVLIALTLAPQLRQLDARDPITYFIEDGKGVPGFQDSDRDLAKLALNAWSRESAGKLRFSEAKAPAGALIRVRWISANEGLFGETQAVLVNGKPGAVVNVMPQVSVQGEPLAGRAARDALLRDTIVYLTCVHELGHAVGLSHTNKFEDIMYFFGYGGDIVEYFMRYRNKIQSRADISKVSGLSSADIQVLHALYKP
jgi:hypothetical protein